MQRFDLQRPRVKPMLLLAIGTGLLPLWLKVPAWVGIASALVLVSATNVGSRLPRWLLLVAVLAASVGVVMQHRGLFTRDAGLSLIVLMASFKLLELKSYRDAMLISALSFFLTFVGLLFYQSLSVALFLFLLLPLHTATVLVLHRLDGWRGLLVLAKDSGRFVLLALPLVKLPGVQRMTDALRRYGEKFLGTAIAEQGVPFYTDARHYVAKGVPTVLYGAGPRTPAQAHVHGADERLRLTDLRHATVVVACAVAELLGVRS